MSDLLVVGIPVKGREAAGFTLDGDVDNRSLIRPNAPALGMMNLWVKRVYGLALAQEACAKQLADCQRQWLTTCTFCDSPHLDRAGDELATCQLDAPILDIWIKVRKGTTQRSHNCGR